MRLSEFNNKKQMKHKKELYNIRICFKNQQTANQNKIYLNIKTLNTKMINLKNIKMNNLLKT